MKKRGRKVNIERIIRAKEFRLRGFSYRQIAKELKADVKSVWRWVNYDVG